MAKILYESSEQIKFVARVRAFYPEALIFAVPNGGGRTPREGAKLKAEGVLAGVPDLFVAVPRGDWHGLFIEMKRTKGGKPSAAQVDIMSRLAAQQYKSIVCYGMEEAWTQFERYYNDKL